MRRNVQRIGVNMSHKQDCAWSESGLKISHMATSPIYKGLSAIGDWMSGNHRFGAFTPGISYAKGHHYLRAGCQIYNNGATRNGVALRYGFWF